jgi:acylpyruvate hydrolase
LRFASVVHEGDELAVAIEGGRAVPLRGIRELGAQTPLSLLSGAPRERSRSMALEELVYRPVVPAPGKVICVGLNYVAHASEAKREVTDYPTLFTKFADSLCGAFDEVPCPPESSAVDYEGELAIVIGERARRVGRERALRYVAGCTVANDVTMRDFQNKTSQWLPGKAWNFSTPVGPELVTLDEVGDLAALRLRTIVNGQTVQEAGTELMIFDIATLVSEISVFTTLEPGDLILTGTPAGIGFRREPPLLLGDGDLVAVEIDGVGRVENRFVAER